MNLNNFGLPTVYSHKEANSELASSRLFESLITNTDSDNQLIRLSPTVFICISKSEDDSETPSCCMINTTDTDHWLSNLDVDSDDDEQPDPEELGLGQGSTNSDGSTTLGKADRVLYTTTGSVDDSNIIDPQNDVIVKPANVPNSYFMEYDHNCKDCDSGSKAIEEVLSRKYGGSVIRHSPTEFTHIRGKTIDDVSTDNSKHYINSRLFQSK